MATTGTCTEPLPVSAATLRLQKQHKLELGSLFASKTELTTAVSMVCQVRPLHEHWRGWGRGAPAASTLRATVRVLTFFCASIVLDSSQKKSCKTYRVGAKNTRLRRKYYCSSNLTATDNNRANSCWFRVCAARSTDTDQWEVVAVDPEHNCKAVVPVAGRAGPLTAKQMAAIVTADLLASTKKNTQSTPPRELVRLLFGETISPTRNVEQNGRMMVKRGALDQDVRSTYPKLVWYVKLVQTADPYVRSVVDMTKVPGQLDRFERCAIVTGFARKLDKDGLLPRVMSYDFCHVPMTAGKHDLREALGKKVNRKPGRQPTVVVEVGRLAHLVGRTASGVTFLIALGVVPTESREQSRWFIKFVADSLPNAFYPRGKDAMGRQRVDTPRTLTPVFHMDRGGPIIAGLEDVLPVHSRVACTSHLRMNINAWLSGSSDEVVRKAQRFFNNAVYATTKEVADREFAKLVALDPRIKAGFDRGHLKMQQFCASYARDELQLPAVSRNMTSNDVEL